MWSDMIWEAFAQGVMDDGTDQLGKGQLFKIQYIKFLQWFYCSLFKPDIAGKCKDKEDHNKMTPHSH